MADYDKSDFTRQFKWDEIRIWSEVCDDKSDVLSGGGISEK